MKQDGLQTYLANQFDVLNRIPLLIPLLLFGFAAVSSSAQQFQFALDLADDNSVAAEQQTQIPLAPIVNVCPDFRGRVEAAVGSRDLAEIENLYQTNAASPSVSKGELARWQPLLAQTTNSQVFLYFKQFDELPPKARELWSDYARRLTALKVTHLAFLRNDTGTSLVLPLIEIDGKLLIVPSEKAQRVSGIKPDGATTGSQPIRSETNSPADGSRR